jgi:hypothetical protein
LVAVPFIYELPDGGARSAHWCAEILEHDPVELEDDGSEQRVELPFFTVKTTAGYVSSGRLWLPVGQSDAKDLRSEGLVEATTVMYMIDGVALPIAGMTTAFSRMFEMVDIVRPGTHAGLASREAAFRQALEIASRTAVRRGRVYTTSYEPMISIFKPERKGMGLVLRDVHGLWRHPVLRLPSARTVGTPLVPLVDALADADFRFWPAAKKARIHEIDLTGVVPEVPEADMAVYDILREISGILPTGSRYRRAAEPSSIAIMDKAEALLDLYEDASAPLPPAAETADLLEDLRFVFEEHVSGGSQIAHYGETMRRFEKWRSMRGHVFEAVNSPYVPFEIETDEALSSFRM